MVLAKEQKQNELALAVFGLANDRELQSSEDWDSGAALQQARTKKNKLLFFFFFELELNHFPKFLYNVLPVLAVNRPECSECLVLPWGLERSS